MVLCGVSPSFLLMANDNLLDPDNLTVLFSVQKGGDWSVSQPLPLRGKAGVVSPVNEFT